MSETAAVLLTRGVRALRRSAIWWTVGIVAFAVLNAAFWPSLEGSDTLEGLQDMGTLLEAFGAQNLASAAGYLDGQIFALMLPLLLSAMAVTQASALTAGDEDAGRLELLHALPVSRRMIWITCWSSSLLALATVAALVAGALTISLPVFSFDGVGIGSVVAATAACALLAAFHASVAYAVGGLGGSRGRAVGIAVLVLVVGYVASFVLPLADALRGVRRWSPWYWALGEQPVLAGVSPLRLLLLTAVIAALVWLGTIAVDRRDIRSP
jgi:ABC-2 type transport system permease protein